MKKAKASGVNIPEAQRTTVQVKLRLDPDVAEQLEDLSEWSGLGRSAVVALLIERQHDSEVERSRWAKPRATQHKGEGDG